MQQGKPSRTALRVAIRRAAHQFVDKPAILDDPIAARIIGPGHERDLERASHAVARDFRCFMAARSRFAEDQLALAFAKGVRQYVVLGAGLDTFAYRNPFPELRVFEVDFPATQEWKRWMLQLAGIGVPANVSYAALDFEHQALAHGLDAAGFNAGEAAFFSWLGVTPYLTSEAFRGTLAEIGRLRGGSGVVFDYTLPPHVLTPERRVIFERLAGRVAESGEPFRLFFTSREIEAELRAAGFHHIAQADRERLNELYFDGRADGLRLSPAGAAVLAVAWV